jgi:hypothetical protein
MKSFYIYMLVMAGMFYGGVAGSRSLFECAVVGALLGIGSVALGDDK